MRHLAFFSISFFPFTPGLIIQSTVGSLLENNYFVLTTNVLIFGINTYSAFPWSKFVYLRNTLV